MLCASAFSSRITFSPICFRWMKIVITLTISELTREFFFLLRIFSSKKKMLLFFYLVYLLHAKAELIREQVIHFIRITMLTLSARDVFIFLYF